jgi:TRAP-type C4-dicarboxylate transport system permease small subunit
MIKKLAWLNKKAETILGAFVAIIFFLLLADVLWGVFSRYVLNAQSQWTEELAIYLLIWVSLLGAAVLYITGGHLGLDYFAAKLHPAAKKVADIIVNLAVLIFVIFVMIIGGTELTLKTLESGQISPALGLKVGIMYSVIPISGILFAATALSNIIITICTKPTTTEAE